VCGLIMGFCISEVSPVFKKSPCLRAAGAPSLRLLPRGCRSLSVWGLQGSLSAGREAAAGRAPEDSSTPRTGGLLQPAETIPTARRRGLPEPADRGNPAARRLRGSRSPHMERLPQFADREAPAARRQRGSRSPQTEGLSQPAGTHAPAGTEVPAAIEIDALCRRAAGVPCPRSAKVFLCAGCSDLPARGLEGPPCPQTGTLAAFRQRGPCRPQTVRPLQPAGWRTPADHRHGESRTPQTRGIPQPADRGTQAAHRRRGSCRPQTERLSKPEDRGSRSPQEQRLTPPQRFTQPAGSEIPAARKKRLPQNTGTEAPAA
jgi:hypothetical protein